MIIKGTKETLSEMIANEMANLISKKPNAKLLLPTGNSPILIYKELIKKHQEGLSFHKIETFNLDEYTGIDVNKSNLSFRNFMKKHLFNFIDIDQKKINFPDTPKNYNTKLDKIKKFDFGLIGVGVNGHIAFNEPPAKYKLRTHMVKLSDSTINSNFNGMINYPTTAITMGLKDIIEKTDRLVLIVWGNSKKEALKKYKEALQTNVVDENWPITYLIKAKNFVIYTDVQIYN